MKAIKYDKSLIKIDDDIQGANSIEIMGIPLIVYTYQKVIDDTTYFCINFTTPDTKVSVHEQRLPAAHVLTANLFSTKKEYDEFVVTVAERVILPIFEKDGYEKTRQMIDDRLEEWDKTYGDKELE